jgi:hypothetical protein
MALAPQLGIVTEFGDGALACVVFSLDGAYPNFVWTRNGDHETFFLYDVFLCGPALLLA